MYLKRTIITIVAVLTIVATANASTVDIPIPAPGGSGSGGGSIPEPTPGGSGGGGGGTPILIGTYLDQTIDFKHFDMTGHVSNWQSGNASFNGKVFLEDGFYNSSFLYADMRQSYFGDPANKRMVYTVIEASFYSHKGNYNLAKPQTNFQTNSNIFFPGIDIRTSSSITSNNGTNSQFPNLFSPNYNYYVDLWVNDGIIKTMNVEPYWNTDGNRIYTRFYLGINLPGELGNVTQFTDSLQQLPEEMQEAFNVVPEPATISLLGLGIAGLLRKRKRQ